MKEDDDRIFQRIEDLLDKDLDDQSQAKIIVDRMREGVSEGARLSWFETANEQLKDHAHDFMENLTSERGQVEQLRRDQHDAVVLHNDLYQKAVSACQLLHHSNKILTSEAFKEMTDVHGDADNMDPDVIRHIFDEACDILRKRLDDEMLFFLGDHVTACHKKPHAFTAEEIQFLDESFSGLTQRVMAREEEKAAELIKQEYADQKELFVVSTKHAKKTKVTTSRPVLLDQEMQISDADVEYLKQDVSESLKSFHTDLHETPLRLRDDIVRLYEMRFEELENAAKEGDLSIKHP